MGIGVVDDGTAGLNISNGDGVTRLAMDVGKDGATRFSIFDASNNRRCVLGVDEHDEPYIRIQDMEEKKIWSAP